MQNTEFATGEENAAEGEMRQKHPGADSDFRTLPNKTPKWHAHAMSIDTINR